ncbi:Protein N-acetyltransferase, RimJ/RimL family [Modestobacter sp. DSM 44400]|uniref:GNAT family N-acetyltransferase n=1 Tax=Modestobacter sp. DSM 44400 TaxID=1550230 RepID=UPI00089A56A7|nr:GNAT family N-acetyltransferase [Modestobacter sp. DSM 44400]SDY90301.1 Protein N-acetyltransferase, RimJ/RimL family [Modestobacter sp. DSM 44400]
MEPFELPAGELRLRPWQDDDGPAVWAALQDPAIRLWNGAGSTSPEDVAALLARRADWSAGGHASFAVTDAAGGALLGSISLHSIDPVQGDAEIGYWTVPADRGRGVAVRSVVAVCGWAFPALALDRIELLHAVGNPASGRVAARAGFTCEGRLRRSYRYGDGVKHDELLWSRLSDDPAPVAG